jgi:hypothetical protein
MSDGPKCPREATLEHIGHKSRLELTSKSNPRATVRCDQPKATKQKVAIVTYALEDTSKGANGKRSR